MADVENSPFTGPVVVTGGCGFIGSHIVNGLLKYEAEVHVIDIKTQQNRFPGAIYHVCDIASLSQVEAVFKQAKPQTVFHVASPDPLNVQPALFRKVNIIGSRNLLVAAKAAGVQVFVYTCSSSVIHDNYSNMLDGDESWPVLQYPVQKRVYTLTKAEAEADILASNRYDGDSSLLAASIRPATAFGERDFTAMSRIIANARQGKAKNQIGAGQNVFDLVYVSNLVDAHILAAKALLRSYGKPPPPPETRVDGEAFFITNDEHVLFWEFSRAIAASVGLPVKKEDIVVIPFWVAFVIAVISEWITWIRTRGKEVPPITREAVRMCVINRTFNIAKAKNVLGYRPKISMEDGLARTCKWFVESEGKKA